MDLCSSFILKPYDFRPYLSRKKEDEKPPFGQSQFQKIILKYSLNIVFQPCFYIFGHFFLSFMYRI